MNFLPPPGSTFVGMPPRPPRMWPHVNVRMSSGSASGTPPPPPRKGEKGTSLSRLRMMQLSVLRRRAQIAPKEKESFKGRELAEALFPKVPEALGTKSQTADEGGLEKPSPGEESRDRTSAYSSALARQTGKMRPSVSEEPLLQEADGSRKAETRAADSGSTSRDVGPVRGSGGEASGSGDGKSGFSTWETTAWRRPRDEEESSKGRATRDSTRGHSTKRNMPNEIGFIDNEASIIPRLRLSSGDGNAVFVPKGPGLLPWKDSLRKKDAQVPHPANCTVEFPGIAAFMTSNRTRYEDASLPWAGLLKKKQHVDNRSNLLQSPEWPSSEGEVKANAVSILAELNEQQRAAVLVDPFRACLVLAGPGSGKTRVLTHRIAYLVQEHKVSPFDILAVTFTNKAAAEMKERVSKLLRTSFPADWASSGERRLTVGTFHSIATRFLRAYGAEIGISPEFVICDSSDSRQIISRLLKRGEGVSPDPSAVGEMTALISKLKNDGSNTLKENWPKRMYQRVAEYRKLYDDELSSMNQLDFDDLLLETRNLLESSEKVLKLLQNKYEHVLVDEWQDTNYVQFDIVSLLAGKHHNLFVVGDADQSIYKFRGADSGNLERFSQFFNEATSISLENNYRSSACIVAAAQCVIEGNAMRPKKQMTTTNEFGNKVVLQEARDDWQEASFVISTLRQLIREGLIGSFADAAIMYRTNAQSRLLEEACIQDGIPYRLLSGTKFYDRREVRDLVAYLRILSNPCDDNAFRRIVNTPPRGIGKKTLEALEVYAESRNLALLPGLEHLLRETASNSNGDLDLQVRKSSIKKLADLGSVLSLLRRAAQPFINMHDDSEAKPGKRAAGVEKVLMAVITETGYKEYLTRSTESESRPGVLGKSMERLGNVDELVRAAAMYSSLPRYLESVTLMVETGKNGVDHEENSAVPKEAASLMTLHGGKGLEFAAVFITGAEDNVIPFKSQDNEADIEEERRLLYVGMTRAKRHLYISWRAQKMMVHGGRSFKKESAGASRFLDDISPSLINRFEVARARPEKKHSTARAAVSRRMSAEKLSEWRVGDSVRCGPHGRGTVTSGAAESEEGAWIEVLFTDGSKHFVNTVAHDVELLYSPSA